MNKRSRESDEDNKPKRFKDEKRKTTEVEELDDDLERAIALSLQEETRNSKEIIEIEEGEDDEELKRAIAESLKESTNSNSNSNSNSSSSSNNNSNNSNNNSNNYNDDNKFSLNFIDGMLHF